MSEADEVSTLIDRAVAREAKDEAAAKKRETHAEALALLINIMRDEAAENRDRIDCAIALIDLMAEDPY